jgi:hypothetical protein
MGSGFNIRIGQIMLPSAANSAIHENGNSDRLRTNGTSAWRRAQWADRVGRGNRETGKSAAET